MGQYWKIFNLTKSRYIDPWQFNGGSKLVELIYNKNPIIALLYLLATEWIGDHIVFSGDYDKNYNESKTMKLWIDMFLKHKNHFIKNINYSEMNLYFLSNAIDENQQNICEFQEQRLQFIEYKKHPIVDIKTKQIVHFDNIIVRNNDTMEYILLNLEEYKQEEQLARVVALLVSDCNGAGGGDIDNYSFNGKWQNNSISVLLDYSNEDLVNYTNIDAQTMLELDE